MIERMPVVAVLITVLGGCPAPAGKPADTSDTGKSAPEATAAASESAAKPEAAPPSATASAEVEATKTGEPSAAGDCKGCRWESEIRPPAVKATGAGEHGHQGKPAGCNRNPTEIKAGQDRHCPKRCCPDHP